MNNLTPEQENDSRDEFEAHYKTDGLCFDRDEDGEYDAFYVDGLWNGWRDRHRTICVELPKPWLSTEDSITPDLNTFYRADRVHKSLQAAGIGVKDV